MELRAAEELKLRVTESAAGTCRRTKAANMGGAADRPIKKGVYPLTLHQKHSESCVRHHPATDKVGLFPVHFPVPRSLLSGMFQRFSVVTEPVYESALADW